MTWVWRLSGRNHVGRLRALGAVFDLEGDGLAWLHVGPSGLSKDERSRSSGEGDAQGANVFHSQPSVADGRVVELEIDGIQTGGEAGIDLEGSKDDK